MMILSPLKTHTGTDNLDWDLACELEKRPTLGRDFRGWSLQGLEASSVSD